MSINFNSIEQAFFLPQLENWRGVRSDTPAWNRVNARPRRIAPNECPPQRRAKRVMREGDFHIKEANKILELGRVFQNCNIHFGVVNKIININAHDDISEMIFQF